MTNSRVKHTHAGQRRHNAARGAKQRAKHRVKLRGSHGVIQRKQHLRLCLLNVDGLSHSSLEDVKTVLNDKSPDLCFLLETKRRHEEHGSDISVPGYDVQEIRRSDAAGDKGGGGIACYTRKTDGIIFKEYTPPIPDPNLHFVRTERVWITTESLLMKTAVCGVYMGCQYPDDRHGVWNQGLLQVIHAEASVLRSQGYRVVLLGDFNSHVGSEPGVGVVGNHDDVNPNGERFLNFLRNGSFIHINGVNNLTTGIWTRQRGTSKSVLDFAVISSEHLSTVNDLLVDDQGTLGGGSDHNFLILTLNDNFVKKKLLPRIPSNKKSWNKMDDVNWESFKDEVATILDKKSPDDYSVDELASLISSALLSAGEKCVGRKPLKPKKRSGLLPRALVDEITCKRNLEKVWKSKVAEGIHPPDEVVACETAFLQQKSRVNDLLFAHKNRNRDRIRQMCAGKSTKARRNFWSVISSKSKQSSEISAVVDPASGALKCGIDEIKTEVENHLCRTFQGSLEPIPVDVIPPAPPPQPEANVPHGHEYSLQPPTLPSLDQTGDLLTDPGGWLNRSFTIAEVQEVLKTLHSGKSAGWDCIPNEFLIHSPSVLAAWITALFNRIKASGEMPRGWNKGRITLIHKAGLRELLQNYRPITVIISLSGLFSKLLNSRLSEVVEVHKLLGEVQNGFRKERCMADNSFILDSILMKSKYLKKNVHLCYVDITKAYDSVNRSVLWAKLSSLGFNGEFLGCLQALYTGDSVDSVVNGVSTCPVYLKRGLRQGCSLSPLLFAIYISDIGMDIASSSEGFDFGGLTISGLLFADDIVLVSRSFSGLEKLVATVKQRCDDLKLLINPSKSSIVTPEDVDSLVLLDEDNQVTLSLSKVLSYKYLGTDTTLLMSTTGSKKQQRCLQTAKKYLFACFYVGRTGPDIIDTVLATWSNIAVPSILSGCEMITFTDTTIQAIERVQGQLAKHALGLPQSTPNICAQTELGLEPFRMKLYQQQLSFYIRLMNLPNDRWVRRVLLDHLRGNWASPYMQYIASIRQKLKILAVPPSSKSLKLLLNTWFLNQTNHELSRLSLHCILPLTSFSRMRYVCENGGCTPLAMFRLNNAGLGNRAPRLGRHRTTRCSLCNGSLNEFHVAISCPHLDHYRYRHTDIAFHVAMCRTKGIFPTVAFRLYLRGLDWNLNTISTSAFLKRGQTLRRITDRWLNLS